MKAKNLASSFCAVDFFCSAGGGTCGLKLAGIDVFGGIDIDESCKETYERNNNGKFLCADISSLKMESLISIFRIRRNQDNLIFVGCSPCQYFSNIKTDKTRARKTRLLLDDFQEFVAYYYPGFVIVENVPGFNKRPDSPLEHFKSFLRSNGYCIADDIVNAMHYGVPQNRRRYVLIASRIIEPKMPAARKDKTVTVRDAIGSKSLFPKIEAGFRDKTKFLHTSASLSPLNHKRIRYTPKDGGDRQSWPIELIPKCYKEHNGHTDVYGRMYWDKPSPTITTRFNSYSNGRYGHPEQNRAISLREGATLQSFPSDYEFISSNQAAIARMIGNAVPPLLAKAIGESIQSSLQN